MVKEIVARTILEPFKHLGIKLFRMVKLAENAGFGFDKIERNWKAYNNTLPDYQIEFDSVILDFQLKPNNKGSTDTVG